MPSLTPAQSPAGQKSSQLDTIPQSSQQTWQSKPPWPAPAGRPRRPRSPRRPGSRGQVRRAAAAQGYGAEWCRPPTGAGLRFAGLGRQRQAGRLWNSAINNGKNREGNERKYTTETRSTRRRKKRREGRNQGDKRKEIHHGDTEHTEKEEEEEECVEGAEETAAGPSYAWSETIAFLHCFLRVLRVSVVYSRILRCIPGMIPSQ